MYLLPFFVALFFSQCSRDPRDLHSFPTRRSSDLLLERQAGPDESDRRADPALAVETNGGRVHRDRADHLAPLTVDENVRPGDRKSTRLNSSHMSISYAVFCLKKKKKK